MREGAPCSRHPDPVRLGGHQKRQLSAGAVSSPTHGPALTVMLKSQNQGILIVENPRRRMYEDACETRHARADTLPVPAGKTREQEDETFRDGNAGVRLLLHSLA